MRPQWDTSDPLPVHLGDDDEEFTAIVGIEPQPGVTIYRFTRKKKP